MIIALLRNILRRPPRRVLPELPSRQIFRDYDGDMRRLRDCDGDMQRLPPVAGASQLELMLLMMKR